MTVYCLIPVHNRLESTTQILSDLEGQDYTGVRVVVIDDGSADGTRQHIHRHYPEVEVLEGNGTLWWSGAIAKGLQTVMPRLAAGDYVLLLNNDVRIGRNYITRLVIVSKEYRDAVVGSPLRDIQSPHKLFSLGPHIDYGKVITKDMLDELGDQPTDGVNDAAVIEADALSGRGTLYPGAVLREIGSIRSLLLPHYWADYEMSIRAKRAGAQTLIAMSAPVFTNMDVSGVSRENGALLDILFSRQSRLNTIDAIVFFTLCGPWYLRVTAVPRLILFKLWRIVKRYLG